MDDSEQTGKMETLDNVGVEQTSSTQSTTTERSIGKAKASKVEKRTLAMISVVIIAVMGVGLGATGMVLGWRKNSEVEHLKAEIVEKDAAIAGFQNATAKCEDEQNADKEPNATEGANANKTTTLNLNMGKCLNCQTPGTWSIVDGASPSIKFYLLAREDKVTAGFVSWDALNEYYNFANPAKSGTEHAVAIDVSGKVVDILASGFGNGLWYETILFLMEDGTVEYIPVMRMTQEGAFRSYGKVPGVENVIKFYTVNQPAGPNSPSSSGYLILAQRADGDYYDLSTILLDTGNYERDM